MTYINISQASEAVNAPATQNQLRLFLHYASLNGVAEHAGELIGRKYGYPPNQFEYYERSWRDTTWSLNYAQHDGEGEYQISETEPPCFIFNLEYIIINTPSLVRLVGMAKIVSGEIIPPGAIPGQDTIEAFKVMLADRLIKAVNRT